MLTVDQFIKNGMKAEPVVPTAVVDRYEKHLPGQHRQLNHAGKDAIRDVVNKVKSGTLKVDATETKLRGESGNMWLSGPSVEVSAGGVHLGTMSYETNTWTVDENGNPTEASLNYILADEEGTGAGDVIIQAGIKLIKDKYPSLKTVDLRTVSGDDKLIAFYHRNNFSILYQHDDGTINMGFVYPDAIKAKGLQDNLSLSDATDILESIWTKEDVAKLPDEDKIGAAKFSVVSGDVGYEPEAEEKHLPGIHSQQKHAGEIKHVSDLLHAVAVGRYVTVSEIYRYAKSIGFVKDKQDFSKIMTQYLRTHKQTSRGHSIYTELPFTQKDSDFEIRRNEVSGRIGRIMVAGMPEKPVEPPPIVPEEKHLPGIHNQQSHAGTHAASKVTWADIESDKAIAKKLHDEDLDFEAGEDDKVVRYAHLLVDEEYAPEEGGKNTEQRLLIDIFGEEYASKLQKQQEDARREAQADWDKVSGPKKLLTRDEELAELENSPAVKHMYAWQASFEDVVNNAPRYYRGVDYEHVKKFLRASDIEPLGDEFAGGADVSMTIDPDVTSVFGDYMLIIDGPMVRQHGAKAFDYTDEVILYNDERGWEAEEQEVVSERPIPKEAVIGIMTPGGDILSLNKGVQKHLPGIHDQMKHAGDRGSSKNIVTFTPKWDLITEETYPGPVPIYRLKNWSDLPNFDKGTYTFTVDRFTDEIIAAPTSRIVHEEMLTHAVPDKSIDDVVRFRIRSGRIEVSTYNAGIVINSAEDELLAYDEIYNALDKIVAIGIPKTYPVSIRTEYGNERYHVISLKSLVEKHLPGIHNQQNHAGTHSAASITRAHVEYDQDVADALAEETSNFELPLFHYLSAQSMLADDTDDYPTASFWGEIEQDADPTDILRKLDKSPDIQQARQWQKDFEHSVNTADRFYRGISFEQTKDLLRTGRINLSEDWSDRPETDISMSLSPKYAADYQVGRPKIGGYWSQKHSPMTGFTLIIDANIARQHGTHALNYLDYHYGLNPDDATTVASELEVRSHNPIPDEAILGVITSDGEILNLKKRTVEKHLPGQHNQDKHAGRRSLEVRTTRGNSIKETGIGEVDLSDYFFIRRTATTPADVIKTLSDNFVATGVKFEYQESELPNKSGIRFTNLVDGYKSNWLKIDKDSNPIRVLAAANDLLRAAGIGTLKVVIDTQDPHEFMVSLKYDSSLDVVPLQEDVDLWHGTTTEKYEKIKEEGLTGRRKIDVHGDVYLTPNKLVAERYARDRAAMEESKPALLRVHLPKGTELDIDDSEFQAYISEDLPPEKITLQKHLPVKVPVDRYSKGQ